MFEIIYKEIEEKEEYEKIIKKSFRTMLQRREITKLKVIYNNNINKPRKYKRNK